MELEAYLDILSEDDIRIRDTRIGIETVIEDFLDGASPEEITVRYPNLTLEQVYAVITYYLANRERIDSYIEQGRKSVEIAARAQDQNPPDVVKRLRRIKDANMKTVRSANGQ